MEGRRWRIQGRFVKFPKGAVITGLSVSCLWQHLLDQGHATSMFHAGRYELSVRNTVAISNDI